MGHLLDLAKLFLCSYQFIKIGPPEIENTGFATHALGFHQIQGWIISENHPIG